MRALVMSITGLGRTVASRAVGPVRARLASIQRFGRSAMGQAEGRLRGYAASILSLGRAVEFDTEGVRAQAILAFTVTFVLAMLIGTLVLPHGVRKYQAAPVPVPEQPAGPAAVAPHVDVLPALPSARLRPAAVLPRSDAPSKAPEEAPRLLNVAPAGQAQATGVAVRTSGSVRGDIARVTEIALWGNPSKPWVSITASGPVRYQLRNVEPNWVVIDLSRAELALTSGKPPAGRGLVRLIRVGQFAPGIVRVVLELTDVVPVHVATSPARNAIVVSLAADARGNSHTEPAPGQRPSASRPALSAPSRSAEHGGSLPSAGRLLVEMGPQA